MQPTRKLQPPQPDDDAKAVAMNAAQLTEPPAVFARGADRMPHSQMPDAPRFDGANVTAQSTNCDATASAVIGHFPYYCTGDVRETVLVLPAFAYCDSDSRFWPALRAEMLNAYRALDSEAFNYTRDNLERLCRAFQDHESDRDSVLVSPRNMELKSFLLLLYPISEKFAASGMMSEYERTMLLVRTLPARMRKKAVGKLGLDPLQPSTFRYADLHNWIVARIAAEDNLELFELLHGDASPSPLTMTTTMTTTASTTTAMTTATEPPTASAATETTAMAQPHDDDRAVTSCTGCTSDREPRELQGGRTHTATSRPPSPFRAFARLQQERLHSRADNATPTEAVFEGTTRRTNAATAEDHAATADNRTDSSAGASATIRTTATESMDVWC